MHIPQHVRGCLQIKTPSSFALLFLTSSHMCPHVPFCKHPISPPICSVHICPLRLFYIPFSLLYPHILNICTHMRHILIFPSPAPLPLLISSNILICPHNVPKKSLKYIFPPPAPLPSSPPPPPPTGRPQAPPGSKCRFAGQKRQTFQKHSKYLI